MTRISTDKAFIGNLDYKLVKGESWAMVEESLVYDGGLILSGSD